MYIKSLEIKESYPEDKLINSVTFKKGANFIVDASSDGDERGNGVGKTTVLKVIDICLGAKDRKYIYADYEMDITNDLLKSYIHDKKVYAELKIVQDLSSSSSVSHTIRVELYERGGRYLDDVKYSLADFHQQLNSIIFNNDLDKPTFRQIIGMFVRIDQRSDNDKFLKFLSPFTSDDTYQNVYSYLFKLGDQSLGEDILALREKIKELNKDLKRLVRLNDIKSINVVQQRLIGVNRDIDTARKKLSILVDVEAMKKNEDAIAQVRTEYAELADEIDRSQFKLERVRAIIGGAQADADDKIDTTVLNNLYDETRVNFSNLKRTFEDLLEFNKQLITNKIAYFENQSQRLEQKLITLDERKEALLDKYRDVVVLIKNNDVDKYVALQAELESSLRDKGKLEKVLELYEALSSALHNAEAELAGMDSGGGPDPSQSVAAFNEYFTQYSKQIVDEGYLLYLTEKSFPVGIANVTTGLSTGTKKSVISAFDLSYQSYAKAQKIASPKFIIHDVIETMDKFALNSTVQISNAIGCQYIVAVLKDKIENNQHIEQQDIRLTLSDDRKWFKI